jgi:protein TonB
MGMLVALGMSLMAFEWASFDLENIKVKEIEIDDLELEPVVENILIERPKPKVVARVKEKEFDPEKHNDFKKVADIDSTIVDNPLAVVDPKAKPSGDPIIDLGGGELKIEPIIDIPDVNAEFPGGLNEMYKYLGKTITYPEPEKIIGTQGKVYVTFVVEKDGSITDLNILRSLSTRLDKEALNAIKKMPKWKPGKVKGEEVRVRFTLPVVFKLK